MTARADESDTVRLDLNNAVFQRQLFALEKAQQLGVLATLRKLAGLRWPQVYPGRELEVGTDPFPERTGRAPLV